MSQQGTPILSLPFTAAAAIGQNIMVSPTGGLPAAAGNTLGVNMFDVAIGERGTCVALGSWFVKAGAAIAAGAAVEVNAAGKVITKAAGVAVGRLAPGQSAAALDDLVEIIPIPN